MLATFGTEAPHGLRERGLTLAVILPPRFASPSLADGELEVLQVEGEHGISKLYRLEIELQSVEPSFPYAPDQVDSLLSDGCVLELEQTVLGTSYGGADAVIVYPFHGVLSEWEVGSIEEPPGEVARINYRAVLVPRLWYTTRSVRTRLFQGMTVPAIIRHILEEIGFASGQDFDFKLSEEHPEREYVLQYRESDFNFISRLAEDEGIFFFFEQVEDREVVTFGDHETAMPRYSLLESIDSDALAHIRYEARANFESLPGLRTLTKKYCKTRAGVVVHDYDYTHPDVANHHATRVCEEGAGVIHYYLEAKEYTRADQSAADPMNSQIQRMATLRAQENALEREVLRARSTALGLFSGCTFDLEDHYDDTLVYASSDRNRRIQYLVTKSRFSVGRSDTSPEGSVERLGFDAQLEIVDASIPYRPARQTPRPVVAGLLTAKVADMVRSTAADIDEYGQYALVLDIETIGAKAMKATTLRRFRMAQPFGGSSYGMHYPLHVGCEVLLAHLGGDPDRPIIVAAVPNFSQRVPVDMSNSTLGGFRTRSNIIDFFNDDA